MSRFTVGITDSADAAPLSLDAQLIGLSTMLADSKGSNSNHAEGIDSEASETEPSDGGFRGRQSWWARECGGREVLALALPLIVSTLSFTVMQFCDRLFLTWYSTLDLSAVVPAGALSWTLVSLPLGIAMYVNTFVAQYQGAGAKSEIGSMVWQAVWIGMCCIPIYILLGYYCEPFFTASGHSERMVAREVSYFRALSYGSGAIVINAALETFYTGRGKTVLVMVVNLLAAGVNIVLDYWMIFGLSLGSIEVFTAKGIEGAGYATTIAIWFKLLLLAILFWQPINRYEFKTLAGWRMIPGKTMRLLRFGLPNGFQFLIEGFAITLFILIIARISETASAATALAFSINMIVFVPVMGIGIAVTTLVGQQIGQRNAALAARATWTSLIIALAYTSVFAIAYVVVPDWFLALHHSGGTAESAGMAGAAIETSATELGNLQSAAVEFEQVYQWAIHLLIFVAVYCLFDTVQLIFVSAIKGAGDTRFVVVVTVVSSLGFLILGFQGDRFVSEAWQLIWWWGALTLWIVALSVTYFLRFRGGKWREMVVIESELLTERQ